MPDDSPRPSDHGARSGDSVTPTSSPDPGTARSGTPETALPPLYARVLAFVAVFIGAAAGGFIGYAFAQLGNFGDVTGGIITLLTGLGFAGGVAVVAVLTLRALGEWRTIREQGPEAVRAARIAQNRRIS